MLSSPAGFGKTTLLSECVSQIQQPVAWVSLDEGDNDPARFWSYLIAACQTAYAGVGAPAQALLQSPQPLLAETIPTILVNDIASLDQELVLVLDDYHVIQDVTIQAAFSFLLDHLPGKLHVLISTRIDPPWSLARFRARNQLVEIRAQDLRFTTEEAAAFLNKVMGLHLKSEDTVALEERTEGWIAGLQLAALSMQGREDISGFVKAFTGSHVYIADYLVEEVLKRQSTEMQEFLLRCSILDRLSPGLCEAVTGLENGRFMLEELCRANLFLISLDDEGEWYRYHHLFADLLRVRLQRGASRVAKSDLHRRAAAWYEKAGLAAEAIEHALAAEDYPHAVELVEKVALPMILQASLQTVEGWLQEIPQGHIAKSPQILVAVAWMYLLRGAIPQAIPSVERLKLLFSTPEGERLSPSLQGEWLAIQAELLMGQGKPEASRDLALRAREILPEVDPQVRGMIYITLAKAFQLTYDYDHAAEAFQMIAREARQAGDYTFEILGISGHAQMTLKQGQLHRTFDIVTEGIRRLEASGKKIPFGATLYGEMGEVYYYWGELDQARKYSQRSMEVSGKSGYSDPEIYHSIMLSKMFLMEGDLEAAAREMQKASDLAGQIPPTMVRENLIAQRVWIDLALDRLEEAEQLLTAEGFSFGDSFRYPKLTPGSNITFTAGKLYKSALRILLYRAKRRGDRSNLERGVDLAERTFQEEFACKHLLIVLETLLLASQLHAALGIERQSLIEAAKALELAEPEGFISIFVEEGEPVEKILIALQKSDLLGKVRPGYVQEILAAFPPKLPSKEEISEGPEVSSLVEALTSRELEVLRLIAEGDSNQVIAEKLVITVSAVKKHTGNIYGKLNINSRTQAVARARQLGLLSQDE
ncbi:MAG: hypothetical protein IT308_06575 [Anaerolineaceae bacterium]|nr:hypothetical protein [Anaerolineaceae bacterium]